MYEHRVAPEKLFHVTPKSNVRLIGRNGLWPKFSKTKAERVYAVPREGILWAVNHVAVRHGVKVQDLVVCEIEDTSHFRLYQRELWYSAQVTKVSHYCQVNSADYFTLIK